VDGDGILFGALGHLTLPCNMNCYVA